jgi:hypothetical protein
MTRGSSAASQWLLLRRQISRGRRLVKRRTQIRNEISAVHSPRCPDGSLPRLSGVVPRGRRQRLGFRATKPRCRPFRGAFQFPELVLAERSSAVQPGLVEPKALAAVARFLPQVLESLRCPIPHGRSRPRRRTASAARSLKRRRTCLSFRARHSSDRVLSARLRFAAFLTPLVLPVEPLEPGLIDGVARLSFCSFIAPLSPRTRVARKERGDLADHSARLRQQRAPDMPPSAETVTPRIAESDGRLDQQGASRRGRPDPGPSGDASSRRNPGFAAREAVVRARVRQRCRARRPS